MGTENESPNLKPKPVRRNRIPSKVPITDTRYIKIQIVPRAEIGGDRGEWQVAEAEDEPCLGLIRLAKELDTDEKWMTFREEMQHALIDAQRWLLYDLGEEEDEEKKDSD